MAGAIRPGQLTCDYTLVEGNDQAGRFGPDLLAQIVESTSENGVGQGHVPTQLGRIDSGRHGCILPSIRTDHRPVSYLTARIGMPATS